MSASIVTHNAIPHLTTQVSEVIRIPDICSGIFVVWGGLTALVLCIWKFVRGFVLPEGLVAWFYAVNLLQWVVIPQKRLVYYYYYPPAMFLGVAIVIALNRANSPRVFGIRLSVLILVAAAVFFGLEVALNLSGTPSYVFPKPTAIVNTLFTDFAQLCAFT